VEYIGAGVLRSPSITLLDHVTVHENFIKNAFKNVNTFRDNQRIFTIFTVQIKLIGKYKLFRLKLYCVENIVGEWFYASLNKPRLNNFLRRTSVLFFYFSGMFLKNNTPLVHYCELL